LEKYVEETQQGSVGVIWFAVLVWLLFPELSVWLFLGLVAGLHIFWYITFSNVVARLVYNDLTDDIATAPHNNGGKNLAE